MRAAAITDASVLRRAFLYWLCCAILLFVWYQWQVADKPAEVREAFTKIHTETLAVGLDEYEAVAPIPVDWRTGDHPLDSPPLMAWRRALLDLGKSHHLDIWLVAAGGGWMIAPEPAAEWGFLKASNTHEGFWTRYPRCCTAGSRRPTQKTWEPDAGGLISIRAVPAINGADLEPDQPKFYLVAHTSRVVFTLARDEAIQTLRTHVGLLGLPLAAICWVLSYWRERSQSR